MFRLHAFVLCTLVVFSSSLIGESTQQIILSINGKTYNHKDIFSAKLFDTWNAEKSTIEDAIKESNNNIITCNLGDIKSIKYRTVDGNPSQVTLKCILDNSRLSYRAGSITLAGYVTIEFDLIINHEVTSEGYTLIFDDDIQHYIDFEWDSGVGVICELWEWIISPFEVVVESKLSGAIDNYLDGLKDENGQLSHTLLEIPMAQNIENAVVPDPEAELQIMLESFPVLVEFDYATSYYNINYHTGQHDNFDNLVIDIELLPGYSGQESIYLTGSHSRGDSVLDNYGFAMNHDTYEYVDATLPWQQQIDATHEVIRHQDQLNADFIRIEAFWKYIMPYIPQESEIVDLPGYLDDPSRQDAITWLDSFITNNFTGNGYGLIADEKAGWVWITEVLENATNTQKGRLEPIIILGYGAITALPSLNIDGDYKIIAPGEPRGADSNDFAAISPEEYLYWLELFARTVIQRFDIEYDIQYWEVECELNAARYAESFYWWRRGSSWGDDTPGGFQDQLVSRLYNAIKEETTNDDVVQCFHMFDLARRLDEWQNYYDIVGLNLYPNELNAEPVLGSLVGELVFATKRALNALSLDRPVWVLETAYGVYDGVYNGKQYHYTLENQAKFLKDALQSSIDSGADLFCWFRPFTPNTAVPDLANFSWINSNSGLYETSGISRPAYNVFKDEIEFSSDMTWVTLKQSYNLTETLYGQLDLVDHFSGVQSDTRKRLYKQPATSYTVKTLNEALVPVSNPALIVHHLNWENYNDNPFLENNFTPFELDDRTQNANYTQKYPIKFSSYPLGALPITSIQLKDP